MKSVRKISKQIFKGHVMSILMPNFMFIFLTFLTFKF